MKPSERTSDSTDSTRDVLHWLTQYGDDLYRYAVARVSRADVAEELVQETFLVAVAEHEKFRGESAVQTWLTGILRRKIVDYFRQRYRNRQSSTEVDELAAFFSAAGHIKNVTRWPRDPVKVLEDREFWATFEQCMKKLRAPWAEAFALRVMDGMATAEVCATLEISESNLSVRLHRARLALRQCLERNWFQRK